MNWEDIRGQLEVLADEQILDHNDMDQLMNPELWQSLEKVLGQTITPDIVDQNLRHMRPQKHPHSKWVNYLTSWFKGQAQKEQIRQKRKRETDDDGRCSICLHGTHTQRERHIKEVALRKYTHYTYHAPVEVRDIPWMLELVYNHARTHVGRNPEIKAWALEACEPF